MGVIKLSIADIMAILRQFGLASHKDIFKSIQYVRTMQPFEQTTLIAFRFYKRHFYIVFDQTAADDEKDVVKLVETDAPNVTGRVVPNPASNGLGLHFKGKDVYLFEVTPEKQRLDVTLAERYPGTSRSTWQKHIKAGHVLVSGQVQTSPKFEVAPSDNIAVDAPTPTDHSAKDLPIIYLDDNVIVVDKPIGVLTHAKGALQDEFTVADFFRRFTTYAADSNRPGIVHRLDRDTSGVIIGARDEQTAVLLQKQFANRKVKKTYYAVVVGHPKEDQALIDLPIGRNPSAPSTFRVDSKGKSAQTQYTVVARSDQYSLLRLQPLTGRTHQLRVHMAYINTPILGDKVYGGVVKQGSGALKHAERLFLHAASLEVTVPPSDRHVFRSPVPQVFTDLFPEVKADDLS